MKLVNLNIGIKLPNTDAVIDFLTAQDADIVALQEVTRALDNSVSAMYRTKAALEEHLDSRYPYDFFGPIWLSNAFRNGDHVTHDFGGDIEQGNQLLSKFPIVHGTNEFFYKHFEYMQDWSNWRQEDHGRPVLITTLNIHANNHRY